LDVSAPITLNVETVLIDRLFCSPSNPRHNDEAVDHVAASLRRFGWRQPIVARPNGEVIAGNTRLKAAKQLGMTEVPVHWFDGSDIDATAFSIADNRSGEFATWDNEALARLLDELRAEDALDGVGFDDAAIDALLAELDDGEDPAELDDPGALDPPANPVTRRGDVWLLGEHRLLCGDSRDRDTLHRLLGDERADLVWTDPPYGVNYESADGKPVFNDEPDKLKPLLDAALRHTLTSTKPGAVWYVAAPSGPNFIVFAQILTALDVWRQTLVWVKDRFVLGRSDFHYQHEAIFYGWTPGAAHRRPPDRSRSTVLEFDRPSRSDEHPTMKPVDLVGYCIEASSTRKALVLDPFGGSGTTLIACQQLGRRARLVEFDPGYCDATIRRWEQATGGSGTLGNDGRTFASFREERTA
jgi:site-specific DNA-methyltransferase (adenine-specific)